MARRWLFYLALNVLVSAVTMLAVLYLWDRSHHATPIKVATPTPLPAGYVTPLPPGPPSPTPIIYIVQSGDTLGHIAEKFGVDVDELAVINNLADPNVLDPGMQLVIPARGQTLQPASRNPTVTPQEGETSPWPVINSVISPGVLGSEAVKNRQSRADREPHWMAAAHPERGGILVQGILAGGAGRGPDPLRGGNRHLDRPVLGFNQAAWHTGDEVRLLNSLGNLRSIFVIP